MQMRLKLDYIIYVVLLALSSCICDVEPELASVGAGVGIGVVVSGVASAFIVKYTLRSKILGNDPVILNDAEFKRLPKLHRAIFSFDKEIIRETLDKKDKVDLQNELNRQNSKGNTALHLAMKQGDIELIKSFLKNGANIYIKNKDGKTPLDMATSALKSSILFQSNRPINPVEWVGKVVSKSDKVWSLIPKTHEKVLKGESLQQEDLLNGKINQRDFTGNTPLMYALKSKSPNPDTLKLLIDAGANPDFSNYRDEPSPRFILNSKFPDVIAFKHDFAEPPLHRAIRNNEDLGPFIDDLKTDFKERNALGQSPVDIAMDHKRLEALRLMLRTRRIDPNTKHYLSGDTPLHVAIRLRHESLVNLLINVLNANPFITNNNGVSAWDIPGKMLQDYIPHPVHADIKAADIRKQVKMSTNPNVLPFLAASLKPAIRREDPDLFKFLIGHQDIDLNRKLSNTGETALHYAVEFGSPEDIKLLFDKGAHLTDRNTRGETALLVAAKAGKVTNLNLLLDLGANPRTVNHYRQNLMHLLVKSIGDKSFNPTRGFMETLERLRNLKIHNRKDILGQTPLDYAKRNGNLKLADYLRWNYKMKTGVGNVISDIPVFLNLYRSDLNGQKFAKIVNSVFRPVFGMGVYHGSLEFGLGDGSEIHYVGEVSEEKGKSIMSTKYTKYFAEKRLLGYIPADQEKELRDFLAKNVKDLRKRFNQDGYDRIENNCNEFTNELLKRLIEKFPNTSLSQNPRATLRNPGLSLTRTVKYVKGLLGVKRRR